MKQFPSILGDVIGPLMIGNSSSHTAASVRIGDVIRQLAGNRAVKSIKFSFDKKSSLATTYKTQGSDVGLLSGLMGFSTHDERIPQARKYADEAGIKYQFEVKEIGPGHPNTYYVEFADDGGKRHDLVATSVGGGMIEITEYMGFPVSIDGGFYETLVFVSDPQAAQILKETSETLLEGKSIVSVSEAKGKSLISIKSEEEPDFAFRCDEINRVAPILPIMSQVAPSVPFITAEEILEHSNNGSAPLWELAALYESERSGRPRDEVMGKIRGIVEILKRSLLAPENDGIKGRILPNQSGLIGKDTEVLGGSFSKNVIKYVTRFMDIKASMGVFLAAPTAGSCGCVSGCVFALAEELGISDEGIARAMLSAGLVGALIAHHSTFAAEIGGCQAECGAGSGMCAAACAEILGCPAEVCLRAASMALQNVLGMVCDPVGNKVEVPCLGKNIMAAFNAIASANMAASGFDGVIPLDETIAAMDSVGRALPREFRCTGLGGLAMTKTSQEIQRRG